MDKLSLSSAEKLQALRNGEKLQASRLQQKIFRELLAGKILYKTGKGRGLVLLTDKETLDLYLRNNYSISNLDDYIAVLKRKESTRSDLIQVSTDSKLSRKRSFKGFLINCYEPVKARLNGATIEIRPTPGLFHFVYDFDGFIPDPQLTIVGIENPENFRHIEKQKRLFSHIAPLFVSRYPQSQHNDLIRWLKAIPNPYLHFGDFDLAGINIYLNEFKKFIPDKSTFFVPDNIEALIEKYGNYSLYDNQQRIRFDVDGIGEEKVVELIGMINRYKKGVEQEVLSS